MPGRLTPSQRLTGPDGLPTAAARLGEVALMAAAAAIGYAAGPDGEASAPRPQRSIAISRLAGELPLAARARRPALASAAAIPAISSGSVRRRRPVAEPAPTAEPTATATATPTPDPAVDVPVATVAPAPAPAAPAPAAPRPSPPQPTETFDSSG